MARKGKDPSEWSDSYRHRIEKYLEKHPNASLDEARGHKPKVPEAAKQDTAIGRYAKSLYNIQERKSNIDLKQKLGIINKTTAKKLTSKANVLEKSLKANYEKNVPGTPAYLKQQEKIKKSYRELEAYGLFSADEAEADIYYH